MVSWSKNKVIGNILTRKYKLYFRVVSFFAGFLCFALPAKAQRFLNERFTCKSYASSCNYLLPFEKDGSFIMAGNSTDSATGLPGIYFERRDNNAAVLRHNFYSLPDYSIRTLIATESGITKISDNRFVLVGTTEKSGCCKLGFILEIDSNCAVQHFEDIYIPYCGLPDSFMYTADIKYDQQGHLLILNHVECSSSNYIDVLMKYDTSYHQIWAKQYSPFALKLNFANGLIIEDDGYTIFGGTSTGGTEADLGYHAQSSLFKVDTAGNLQWSYLTPPLEWNSIIFDVTKTKDGGYVFLENGNTINTYPLGAPRLYLMSKNIMVKIDATRSIAWKKELTSYFDYFFSYDKQKIVERPDGSLIIQRWDNDSIGRNKYDAFIGFQKFTNDGISIWRKRFRVPMDTPASGSGQLNDFIVCSNGDLIMGGEILDSRFKAPAPIERAWLIKTDSNGCMGPGLCEYVSVPEIGINNAVLKIYPNPATNTITISKSFTQSTVVQFLDLSGRMIGVVYLGNGELEKTVQIEHWHPGIYFLKSTSSNMSSFEKIIKL